jgi:DNA polymerase-3 subunit beta
MSLVVNIAKDDLLSALAFIQNITTKPGTLAILSNILIETKNDTVELTGTDLEVGVRQIVPAEILAPGSITLPSKKLFEIVRESNDEHIYIEVKEKNWVKIVAGASDYNVAGMASEDFPTFPVYKEENLISLPAEDIKDIIEKTIFSVASDTESTFTLTGLLIEKEESEGSHFLRMVSSDGHRLSLMKKKTEKELTPFQIDNTTIIPRKGAQEIKKMCEKSEIVSIGFEKKQAVLKSDNTTVIIRLMNGDFPDFRSLLDVIDMDKFIEIDRNTLLNSMKRMNLFAEEKFNIVKWHMENNVLALTSQSMDIGNAHETIPIEYSDESLVLGFNGRYFVDTLQVMTSNTVKIFLSGPGKPCLIKSDKEPDFISVIMPMEL